MDAISGYCPNCWGKQEFQNEIKEAAVKRKIDLNNVDKKLGWIQGYAAKYLTGIKLKKDEQTKKCPTCHKMMS